MPVFCQLGMDSNPRPADYESAALPLSYTGSVGDYSIQQIENSGISLNCQDIPD